MPKSLLIYAVYLFFILSMFNKNNDDSSKASCFYNSSSSSSFELLVSCFMSESNWQGLYFFKESIGIVQVKTN